MDQCFGALKPLKADGMNRTNSTFLALDWKQFNKAMFDVIDDLHNVIKDYIIFDSGCVATKDYPDTWTKPEKSMNLRNWMTNAIKHTPDVLPNGDMYQRQYAEIASAFFQTELLDSMYNYLMLLTVLEITLTTWP